MAMQKLIGQRCWIAENVRHTSMRGMAGRVVGIVEYDNSLLVETDDDFEDELRGHIGRDQPYGVLWRWIKIGKEETHGPITRLDAHEIVLAPPTITCDELAASVKAGDKWKVSPNVELTGGALAPSSDRRERG